MRVAGQEVAAFVAETRQGFDSDFRPRVDELARRFNALGPSGQADALRVLEATHDDDCKKVGGRILDFLAAQQAAHKELIGGFRKSEAARTASWIRETADIIRRCPTYPQSPDEQDAILDVGSILRYRTVTLRAALPYSSEAAISAALLRAVGDTGVEFIEGARLLGYSFGRGASAKDVMKMILGREPTDPEKWRRFADVVTAVGYERQRAEGSGSPDPYRHVAPDFFRRLADGSLT